MIVDLGVFESEKLNLEIFNIEGVLIYSELIKSAPNGFRKEINLANKKPGTYFIKIVLNNDSFIRKFIIE